MQIGFKVELERWYPWLLNLTFNALSVTLSSTFICLNKASDGILATRCSYVVYLFSTIEKNILTILISCNIPREDALKSPQP